MDGRIELDSTDGSTQFTLVLRAEGTERPAKIVKTAQTVS